MTLLEVCEPLFLYVCRLSRLARTGRQYDQVQVRTELEAVFLVLRTKAAADPAVEASYRETEAALVAFVDDMIRASALSFASDWPGLTLEPDSAVDGARFFELLDQALDEPDDRARERLAVFYTCLGLGFTGARAGQTEQLRRTMRELAERIGDMADLAPASLLCPEAYACVDAGDLVEPPARKLAGMGAALAVLAVALLLTNLVMCQWWADGLVGALRSVVDRDAAVEVRAGTAVPATPAAPAGKKE